MGMPQHMESDLRHDAGPLADFTQNYVAAVSMIPMAPLEVLLKRPCTPSSNTQNLIPACTKAFRLLADRETCFGWEEPLLKFTPTPK